jgi:hypothetical protein
MMQRRQFVSAAASLPLLTWCKNMTLASELIDYNHSARLVLSDFRGNEPQVIDGGRWRGFSDRVMGGISNARLDLDTVAGVGCARLRGNVTRESNGGFIQMAMYFGGRGAEFDASAYRGLELLVYGNDEDYNVHVRTADCGWHDQSYRHTFLAKNEWQRIRIAWEDFEPNRLREPLDAARLSRIGVLGWMREFEADIALAEISLYA